MARMVTDIAGEVPGLVAFLRSQVQNATGGVLLLMKAPPAEKEELIPSTVLINMNEALTDEADGAPEPWTAPIVQLYEKMAWMLGDVTIQVEQRVLDPNDDSTTLRELELANVFMAVIIQ
jgi:hypothetical protein